MKDCIKAVWKSYAKYFVLHQKQNNFQSITTVLLCIYLCQNHIQLKSIGLALHIISKYKWSNIKSWNWHWNQVNSRQQRFYIGTWEIWKKSDVHVCGTLDVVYRALSNCAFDIVKIYRLIIAIWEFHIRSIVQRNDNLLELRRSGSKMLLRKLNLTKINLDSKRSKAALNSAVLKH